MEDEIVLLKITVGDLQREARKELNRVLTDDEILGLKETLDQDFEWGYPMSLWLDLLKEWENEREEEKKTKR